MVKTNIKTKFKTAIEKFKKEDEKERLRLANMAFKARLGSVRKPSKADIDLELVVMEIAEDIKGVYGKTKVSKGDALKTINKYIKSGQLARKDKDNTLWILQKIYRVSKMS